MRRERSSFRCPDTETTTSKLSECYVSFVKAQHEVVQIRALHKLRTNVTAEKGAGIIFCIGAINRVNVRVITIW